ncbi:MAG: family 20 glycosylhydrolase [Bacteroidota bacterium]|nr:family 20 glycosylhydrolase [Bacteroidota bacterium]
MITPLQMFTYRKQRTVRKAMLLALAGFITLSGFAQKQQLPNEVVPAVRQFRAVSREFTLSKNTKICINPSQYAQLIDEAEILRHDIATSFGLRLPVLNTKPRTGDIYLSLSDKKGFFNDEGYAIEMNKKINLKASGISGIFYASRTLLQMLMSSSDHRKLPCGTITDYPQYKVRAMMLDVGRKYFPVNVLKDYIRCMGWLKMNELHLHLNDNANGDYGSFRIESKKFPQLTAKDGFYTQLQIRELQDFAHAYGVRIIPEFDSPGHAKAFTNIYPDLMQPVLGSNYLDITKKETYELMESVFDEFIPLFDATDVHIGTDEYRLSKIKDVQEKENLGEMFRQYINHFNRYISAKGKRVRIWSGYEFMPGTTLPDTSVIIDMWETSDAKAKSDAGYRIINSSQYWTYIVPGAPYYGVDNQFLYEKWSPTLFNAEKPENNLTENDSHLLGGKLHVWNDLGPRGYTMNEIARLVLPSMWVMSEKLWGTKGSSDYASFLQRIVPIQKIPEVSFTEREILSDSNGLIYSSGDKIFKFDKKQDFFKLPWGIFGDKDCLEYPWTFSCEINLKDNADKAVILSNDYVELYANLTFQTKSKRTKNDTIISGVGFDRANCMAPVPLQTFAGVRSTSVFNYQHPLNSWVKLTFIGEEGKTSLYADGKFMGSIPVQMVCPLNAIGNCKGESMQGEIKNIKIFNRITDFR